VTRAQKKSLTYKTLILSLERTDLPYQRENQRRTDGGTEIGRRERGDWRGGLTIDGLHLKPNTSEQKKDIPTSPYFKEGTYSWKEEKNSVWKFFLDLLRLSRKLRAGKTVHFPKRRRRGQMDKGISLTPSMFIKISDGAMVDEKLDGT